MCLLIYTTLSASPCSAREAQGTLMQSEEGKRGNGACTRSSCKTGQIWPLMIPHAHSQPITPTAHNVSVFMEDDKGLSHLPVNTFHQTGITFKLSLSFSSSEQAAALKPTLPHTGLSHLLVTATEQNFCSYLQWSSLNSFHFAHTSHYSLTLILRAVGSRAPKSHKKDGIKPCLTEMKTRHATGFGKATLSWCVYGH